MERDVARVLGVLLGAIAVACVAGFVLAVVSHTEWPLAIAYASIFGLYAISLILRRLAQRIGVERLWTVPSPDRTGATSFHLTPLIVLLCSVVLQLVTNPLPGRLSAGVRLALLIGALVVMLAYLADLIYELRRANDYLPPPRDLRAL